MKRLRPQLFVRGTDADRARARLAELARDRPSGATRILGVEAPASVVYPRVEGVSLAQLADTRRRFGRGVTWPEIRELLEPLAQIVDGLPCAHGLISARNVLLTTRGPILTDFGLGQALPTRTLAIAHASLGVPWTLGPEYWSGGIGVERESDVHALGALVLELLGETVSPRSRRAAGGRDGFSEVLAAALAPRPVDRPGSAVAWALALGDAANRRFPEAPTPR